MLNPEQFGEGNFPGVKKMRRELSGVAKMTGGKLSGREIVRIPTSC